MKKHMVFHHALHISPELCIGCTHCLKACPTQAIRVRNGLAEIFEERCVDCGECYKACPVSAISVKQDDFSRIYDYSVRIVLLPSVFIGQFPSAIGTGEIFGALFKLGFTHIFEIDSVVDMVQEGYDRYMEEHRDVAPHISSFCPAIVRLIQVRFPSLVDNLIRVKPPSDIAAIHYREMMEKEGYSPDETGVFYVTPCAAKIASIKAPVGEQQSPVNGVINMEFLYNRILHLVLNREVESANDLDTGKLTSKGILWSMTRGESSQRSGRCLAVDGMSNVTEFLERIESEADSHIDFMELRACDESCAGGILIGGNRFLTVERLNRRSKELSDGPLLPGPIGYDPSRHGLGKIEPRSMLVLDPERNVALEKMKKVENLLRVLPGIDCSACGSPTCRSLAEDIVQGRAEVNHCIYIQELQIQKGKLSLETASEINAGIWGKERNYRSQIY
jgi:Na+-translocating ferredoxin:NAD+ oxidoreductase RNF subunit RnfB